MATMIRFTGGDWDLAEECAQDAFAQALRRWPETGVPDQPLAWLTTTARNRAIDQIRRAATEAAKLREVAAMEPDPGPVYVTDSEIPDERLELMFTCCHPSLNTESQVALTLRSLTGMSHGGDRTRLPGARAHHGAAIVPGQAEGRARRHPVPGATRASASRSAYPPYSMCSICSSTRVTAICPSHR